MFADTAEEFELQCRIQNKPYDIFGTWFNSEYVISGELRWLGRSHVSESKLWLNKVSYFSMSRSELWLNEVTNSANVLT